VKRRHPLLQIKMKRCVCHLASSMERNCQRNNILFEIDVLIDLNSGCWPEVNIQVPEVQKKVSVQDQQNSNLWSIQLNNKNK
jgi:hypothetical protein